MERAAYLQSVRRFMEEGIPFNAVLGLKVEALGEGHAVLRMPVRAELVGNPAVPALHGGSLSALADTAGGAALFASVPEGDSVSTIDLRIDYLRPAARVDTVADAHVVRLGGRVGVTRIRVWQPVDAENDSEEALDGAEEGRVIVAEATGVYAIRRRR